MAERRKAAQRDGLKVAPKRFDRARQAIATLRRVGRKDEASRRTRKLRSMERDYWQQVSGVQFEAAEADASRRFNHDFEAKQSAKAAAFHKTRTKLANAVDEGVKRVYRANLRTVDDEMWRAAHYAKHGDATKLGYMLDLHGESEVHRREK